MAADRFREHPPNPIDAAYLEERAAQGLVAVEIVWEKQETRAPVPPPRLAVPYGWRAVPGAQFLEEDQDETAILRLMLDRLIDDQPFWKVAEELNAHGRRTRGGEAWSQVAIFELLPRLVEMAPALFRAPSWQGARDRRRTGGLETASAIPRG